MTDRAVSTAVDVTLCLLLVSASAVLLATATQPPATETRTPARTAAVLLGSTTERADYRLPDAAVTGDDPAAERTAAGTTLQLLAAAAVSEARWGPESGSVRPVRAAVERLLARVDGRVRVVATWRPYPGADVAGRVAVGPRPPPGTDVDAVALPVPVGDRRRARLRRAAARGGFDALARALARQTVSTLFHPVGAAGREWHRPSTAAAVAAFAADQPVDLADSPESPGRRPRTALVDALTRRFAAGLRDAFESPAAAARGATVDRVVVVVRAWSP